MSTPHNEANKGDFAKTVLRPGDPLRAKFIAETFLTDVKQVNTVRNRLGYTGYYKGKKVSVRGSGRGMPSIGIYSYELFHDYGVERIIRIGTAGATVKDLNLFDIVVAQGASTNSAWQHQYGLTGTYSAISSYPVLEEAVKSCREHKYAYKVGQVLSSDNFYNDNDWQKWADRGILAVEREAYALFSTAAQLHKEALAILTISDSLVNHQETTSEERVKSFTHRREVALDCIKE